MTALLYRGRTPDSDSIVIPKSFADSRYAATKVTSSYITTAVNNEMINAVTPNYVDTEDNFLAHKSAVDAADAGYIPVSALGVANGVAQLGSDVYIPSAQLPTVQTERVPFFKNADSYALSGSATHECLTINPREFQLASLAIPDLGYPYTPLFFATVHAGSVNGNPVSRVMGTGNYAQISVFMSDNTRYAFTLTGGQMTYDTFTCQPSADVTTSISGAQTFGLWVGLQSGTTYTFSGVGLQFYVLCFPGLS